MDLEKIETHKWKIDFWTIFFSVISLILFNLSLFVSEEQRIVVFGFFIISIIFAMLSFYYQKVNFNEKSIVTLNENIKILSDELTEKFNYLREIYNIKVDVAMLKKRGKRAEINLIDLIKILVAVILIYVIFETIKSLG